MSLVFFCIGGGGFLKILFVTYYMVKCFNLHGYYKESWADCSLSLVNNSWSFIVEVKVTNLWSARGKTTNEVLNLPDDYPKAHCWSLSFFILSLEFFKEALLERTAAASSDLSCNLLSLDISINLIPPTFYLPGVSQYFWWPTSTFSCFPVILRNYP